jgi:tyrosine-specific transport protein
VVLLNLLYGEVVLRTSGKHRFVGYAAKYLGPHERKIASFTFFFGLYGSLLAYLVLGGEFLSFLFPALSSQTGTVLFCVVGFLLVARGLKTIGIFEALMTALLVVLLLFTVGKSLPLASESNLPLWGVPSLFFLPYGIVLFALGGSSAIPEMRGFFTERPRLMRHAIVGGTLIPVVLYALFTISVLGVSGSGTTPEAIEGLLPFLGRDFAVYGAIMGLLAVATSFFTLSIVVEDSFRYDFRLPVWKSLLLAFSVPLALFLLGAQDFIAIISWVGAVLGSIEGFLLLRMHKKAARKGDRIPEYSVRVRHPVRVFFYLIFAGALLYQIIYTVSG